MKGLWADGSRVRSMGRRAELAVRPTASRHPDVFRRFFLTGIAAMLTAGGTLGAVVLIRIAAHHSFTSVPIFDINAHAQAQIYGWVGMFVMGFSYQAFPRFWNTRLARPRLVLFSWALMVAGVLLRAFGEPFHATPVMAAAALAGATAQLAAVSMYGTVLWATARDSRQPRTATDRYIAAAVAWFVLAAGLDLFHLARTLAAPTAAALVRQVAIWQFPLRDLQIQGVAMMMIFGVSLRQFSVWFGTPPPDQRRARRLWLPLQLAVITEVVAFVVAMATRAYVWMAAYGAATVALLVSAALYVVCLRTWARVPTPDRSLKFVRAAQAWLLVALAMLVAAPAYFALVGTPFSHAWYGAMRHAITVGFISLTIMGVAAKVVSAHAAPWAPRLGDLRLPFVLVNAGCVLRVVMQVTTDFTAGAFPIAGASGILEVSGFALWGFELGRRMLAGYPRAAAAPRETGA